MIKGIAHVALYTGKFESTIAFYKEAFGAKEIGNFETNTRGCWLKVGESILELFEEKDLSPEGCFKHIAFQCDSVDESYNKALLAGAVEHIKPNNICLELNVKQELRIAFVKGINGEQIELCESK